MRARERVCVCVSVTLLCFDYMSKMNACVCVCDTALFRLDKETGCNV